MPAVIIALSVVTAGAGLASVAAGLSLMLRTTRSPVARLICRVGLGIETDDLEKYLEHLFNAHTEARPEGEHMTLERYRRSLRAAGASLVVLGALLLIFLAYAASLLSGSA